MKNPFIWLSGADPEIINRCGDLAHSERNKFFGFGTTVIIPAVFGCLALGYAVSTFIPKAWVYIPAAIIWFFTILAIDRFLVSTLFKSRIHKENSFYFALAVRLFLALVLGIVISHPLILFIFHESINEQIKHDHRNIFSTKTKEIQDKMNSASSGDIALLSEKEDKLECTRTLWSYEGSGIQKEAFSPKNKSCGASTGKRGCGPDSQCKKIYEKTVMSLEKEIKDLRKKIKDVSAPYKPNIDGIAQDAKKEPSYDYIARTRALENLGRESLHIWWAEKLILLALVLVDCLLVLLKATTPIGAYEIKKDQLFYEVDVLAKAEREGIDLYVIAAAKDSYKLRVKARETMREIEEIASIPRNFLNGSERQSKHFDQDLKAAAKNMAPDAVAKMQELHSDAFRKTYELASTLLKS